MFWALVVLAAPLIEPHLGGVVLVGPTSPHPSSVFWNPAALAQNQFRGAHVFLSGSQRLDRTTIERDSIDPATGEPGPGRDFDPVTTSSLSPGGFAAAVTDFSTERYRFGLSVYTPFSEVYPDAGDALGYHVEGGAFRSDYATATIAVRATSQLYFGMGFSLVFSQVDMRWSRDRGLEACPAAPCAVEDPSLAERMRLQSNFASGLALSFNAGVMYRMPRVPSLWLGGAYISFPIPVQSGSGTELRLYGDSEVTGLEADGQTGYRLVGDSRTGVRLPQMVHLGARYEFTEDTHAVFSFRWIDLSKHRLEDVRIWGPSPESKGVPEVIPRFRGLKDVFSIDGGVEHALGDALRLGARLRLETSGVAPNRLAPHQVDAPKADVSVGAEVGLLSTLNVTAGYSLAILLPEESGESAFSPSAVATCRASGFDLDVCAPVRDGRGTPTAAGSYSRMTHELVVGLEYQWF